MKSLIAGFWAFSLLSTAALADCRIDRAVFANSDGSLPEFTLEIADSATERATGLMNRVFLNPSTGMLFVYPEPQTAAFWMKNTLIALDLVFIDETGLVTKVHPNAKPMDETVIDGGRNIRFVLEINGGLAARLAIEPGSLLQHPLIDRNKAAFPCE